MTTSRAATAPPGRPLLAVAQNRGKLDRQDHVTATSPDQITWGPRRSGVTGKVDTELMAAIAR
jgi:hypothetical protein